MVYVGWDEASVVLVNLSSAPPHLTTPPHARSVLTLLISYRRLWRLVLTLDRSTNTGASRATEELWRAVNESREQWYEGQPDYVRPVDRDTPLMDFFEGVRRVRLLPPTPSPEEVAKQHSQSALDRMTVLRHGQRLFRLVPLLPFFLIPSSPPLPPTHPPFSSSPPQEPDDRGPAHHPDRVPRA